MINPADTADFTSYDKRVDLARIGVFSIDRTAKREADDLARRERQFTEDAYELIGTTRRAEHGKVAGELAPKYDNGTWVTSTREYAQRCRALDAAVIRIAHGE